MTSIVSRRELVGRPAQGYESDQNSGAALNDKGAMYDDVRASMAKIKRLIDDNSRRRRIGGQAGEGSALYNESLKTMPLSAKDSGGYRQGAKATGQAAGDRHELHEQIKGTMDRIDVMLDKINKG